MPAQVRIGGQNANVILQGNDNITADDGDQTFTFPDDGGELLTNAANTNTGTGGTAGQAQVVGYQTGLWVPVAAGLTTAGSYTYENGRSAFWSRIGSTVTVAFRIYRITVVSNGEGTLVFTGVPYSADGSQGTHVSPGSARLSNVDFAESTGSLCSNISSSNDNISIMENISDTGSRGIRTDTLYTGNTQTEKSSIYITLTYFTADTTWTPIAGSGASVMGTPEYQARLAEIASNPRNFEVDE